MLQLLAILLQASPSPPVPAPPADSLAAAVQLWADHPPEEFTKQQAIDSAVAEATRQALLMVGMQSSPKLSVTKIYLGAYDRLKPLIARKVPVNRSQLDTAVAACAVDGIARRLSTSEIAEVRQSLSTAAGQKFWEAAGITDRPLEGCYQAALNLKPVAADYLAAGLRPPAPPKPLKRDMSIVY